MFTPEVWLTPLILLPGVALLTVSTAHRFGQVQVEFHRLLDHPDSQVQIVARSLAYRLASASPNKARQLTATSSFQTEFLTHV